MDRTRKARAYLGVATVIWGSTFIVLKLLLTRATPWLLVGVRFGLAAAVCLAVLLWRRWRVEGKVLRRGAFLGLLLLGGYALQTLGLVHTGAGKSGFITALYVVLTPFFAWPVCGRRIRWRELGAAAVSLAGVYLLADPSGPVNPGDLLTLGSAAIFALHLAFIDRWAPAEENEDSQLRHEFTLTTVQMVVVGVGAMTLSPLLETPRLALDAVSIPAFLYLSLAATVLVVFWQMRWQPKLGAGRAALIYVGEAVIAAAGGAVFFAERLPWYGYAGMGLILAAILWGNRRGTQT
ncbi:MAG TPA: DMT family transporter [bacterium]|nr:DMT family transporter [bacterium]